jgi:hypothetical protein
VDRLRGRRGALVPFLRRRWGEHWLRSPRASRDAQYRRQAT